MKILKPGAATVEVYFGCCRRCGCELQAALADLQTVTETHPRTEEEVTYYYCRCPTEGCYSNVFVTGQRVLKPESAAAAG